MVWVSGRPKLRAVSKAASKALAVSQSHVPVICLRNLPASVPEATIGWSRADIPSCVRQIRWYGAVQDGLPCSHGDGGGKAQEPYRVVLYCTTRPVVCCKSKKTIWCWRRGSNSHDQ